MFLVKFLDKNKRAVLYTWRRIPSRDITMLMCHGFNELTSRIQENHGWGQSLTTNKKKMVVINLLYMHYGAIFIIFQNKTLKWPKINDVVGSTEWICDSVASWFIDLRPVKKPHSLPI
jgi:hypothetical protein